MRNVFSSGLHRGSSGYVRVFVINFIRFVLLLGIVVSFLYGRDLVLLFSLIGFFVTFVPFISSRVFGVDIPAEFEIIVLFFVYGLFVFAEMRGFYAGFVWLGFLINFGSGIILGFVGLNIVYDLEDLDVLKSSPFVIVFFTFCFAFSIGGLWQLFEFFIDTFFGFGLQRGSLHLTMLNFMMNSVSALFVSIIGYYNYQRGRRGIFSSFLFRVVRKNSRFFKGKKDALYHATLIEKMINSGEGDRLEFKSTLRKNLHTGETDRKIEHSVLKTICGYLNTRGGVLLIGISDDGSVVGLEHDDFASHDRLRIYLTGLLRGHIGNQYLPYINFEVYEYKGKSILRVNCFSSRKRVFLKWNGNEEFYVRHGASTLQLHGSALIDYVSERF